jgi:predicted TIM-barrel fold metal-dependent hydrolase
MTTEKPKSPPPIRDVRKPQWVAPRGSVDCHVHIIGPQNIYPISPNSPVTTDDATLEDFRKVQSSLGIDRALIVGSIMQGVNYQQLLHVLCQEPDIYRGVAMLPPDITDKELAILDAHGVVGARFVPGLTEPDTRMLARVQELGWSAHFLIPNIAILERWKPLINAFAGRFVIEHAGTPNPEEGLESAHFQAILNFLDTDRCWIKLSPRFSKLPDLPFEDTLPFIHKLVALRPDRLLYSSDYPHPNYWAPMPNEADLLDLMLTWAPSERDRELIMVRNAEELFGFPRVG